MLKFSDASMETRSILLASSLLSLKANMLLATSRSIIGLRIMESFTVIGPDGVPKVGCHTPTFVRNCALESDIFDALTF